MEKPWRRQAFLPGIRKMRNCTGLILCSFGDESRMLEQGLDSIVEWRRRRWNNIRLFNTSTFSIQSDDIDDQLSRGTILKPRNSHWSSHQWIATQQHLTPLIGGLKAEHSQRQKQCQKGKTHDTAETMHQHTKALTP